MSGHGRPLSQKIRALAVKALGPAEASAAPRVVVLTPQQLVGLVDEVGLVALRGTAGGGLFFEGCHLRIKEGFSSPYLIVEQVIHA